MGTPIPLAELWHYHLRAQLPGILEGHSLCQQGEDKLGGHLLISLRLLGSSAGQASLPRDTGPPASLILASLTPTSLARQERLLPARRAEIRGKILPAQTLSPGSFPHIFGGASWTSG